MISIKMGIEHTLLPEQGVVTADADAEYEKTVKINLSAIVPTVA